MYMGIPYPIKNPMTAPSSERMMLTSMAKKATIVDIIIYTHVNFVKSCSRNLGLPVSVINSFLVKKSMIGMTEKF